MTDTDRGAEGAAEDTAGGAAAPTSDALTSIRATFPGTLIERMGIEILEASASEVTGTMPVAGNTQPYGLLHGGASVVLAETLGSLAAMLHAGQDRHAVGVEVNATHHRAARNGSVTGRAVALHLGSTTATYEVVVVDSTSRRVCTARLTCLLIPARRPA